jgi:hypothetical protein
MKWSTIGCSVCASLQHPLILFYVDTAFQHYKLPLSPGILQGNEKYNSRNRTFTFIYVDNGKLRRTYYYRSGLSVILTPAKCNDFPNVGSLVDAVPP